MAFAVPRNCIFLISQRIEICIVFVSPPENRVIVAGEMPVRHMHLHSPSRPRPLSLSLGFLFASALSGQQSIQFQGSVPSGTASATPLALKLDDAIQRGLRRIWACCRATPPAGRRGPNGFARCRLCCRR